MRSVRFDPPLTTGVLIRRYKRFLADIRLDDGREITAHVANTGAMTGCAEPGWRVALSHHPDKGRKLPFSWELVRPEPPWGSGESWALVNTARTNTIVGEALRERRVPALAGYRSVRPEVRWDPESKSRFDFLLEDHDGGDLPCFVEVKNVTLRRAGVALFPDTVTARGTRHVHDLATIVQSGRALAAMFYLVARQDCGSFAPAADLDPEYAAAVAEAKDAGVACIVFDARLSLEGFELGVCLRQAPRRCG